MDYVPRKRNDRYLWLKGISTNITAEGTKMGLASGEAAATKTLVDALVAKMDATDAAQAAVDGVRQIETAAEVTSLAQLRGKIKNWKTLANYPTSGSEAVLQLRGSGVAFDPSTYKPALTVTQEAGQIKIAFAKKGVDGLAIYSRLGGTGAWHKIGVDTASPYYDTAPLAQPGVPEVREYKARGLVGDDEVGLDSDVVSATFAG